MGESVSYEKRQWKKTIAHKIKPLKSNSNRLPCVEVQLNENYNILIINAYMPNGNFRVNHMDPIFEEEVDNIEQLCHKYSSGINDMMLVGDLNIDLIRENAHFKHISQLAERYGLTFCRNHINVDYRYTHEHPVARHYSSIDHFIVPPILYDCIDTGLCINNALNPSSIWH